MGLTELQMHQNTRYNRLSVAALVLAGLAAVGLFLAGLGEIAVLAVGAGHVSLNQIRLRGGRGRRLAITALAIGYAIGIFSLLSTLYFAITFAAQQL